MLASSYSQNKQRIIPYTKSDAFALYGEVVTFWEIETEL
jgi:hypothetical protein